MEQIAVVSAINVKGVGCNGKAAAALEETDTRQIHLFRVWGQISGLEQGETELGEYFGFVGRFQAENMQEGTGGYKQLFESGKMFLPPGVHDALLAQCRTKGVTTPSKTDKRAKTVDLPFTDGGVLNFAYDILVRRASNASGISYIAKPMLEPTEVDPLSEIRKAMAEVEVKLALGIGSAPATKQLEAPATKQLEAPATDKSHKPTKK